MRQENDYREIKGLLTSNDTWVSDGTPIDWPYWANETRFTFVKATTIRQYFENGQLNYKIMDGDWIKARVMGGQVVYVWYGEKLGGNQTE